jgi:hypothetical protein
VVTNADGTTTATDLASAEIFNPATGIFSAVASTLATARQGHLAFLLAHNNNVLIVGGTSAGTSVASSELFTPWLGTFAATSSLSTPRSNAAGSAMQQDGLLLVAGGQDAATPPNALASTELYGFATVKTDQADYAPGSIVTITGSGWKPGETVTLSLVESPLIDTHPNLSAVADANGNIFNNQFSPDVHDINVRFYVTATGSVSQAQTTFTDANPQTLSITTAQSPNPVTAGSLATYTVTETFNGNTVQCKVDLTAAPTASPAWPSSGVSFSFAPSTLISTGADQTSSLTITTPSGMTANTYNFTITATPETGSCQQNPKTLLANGTLVVIAPVATSLALAVPNPTSVPYSSSGQVTFSATLTRTSGGTAVAGATVVFNVDGSSVGTAATNSAGVATLSTYNPSALIVAGHNVQASFALQTISNITYAASTSGTQTLTVNPKPVTANITANNKAYDATTTATIATCALTGVLAADSTNVTCTVGSAAFADKNVGTGKTVTATGITLGGTAAGNYTLTSTTATTTANIMARTLHVTRAGGKKV